MSIIRKLDKIIGPILFVIIIIFFSTLNAKNLDKYYKGKSISNYFSGILLLNQNKYDDSYKYLKRLNGLEDNHSTYSKRYLYALIKSENFIQAFNFSKKLERDNQDIFESNLIIGIYHLKNNNIDLSNKYFLNAKKKNLKSILELYTVKSLYFWSNLRNKNINEARIELDKSDDRFQNLKSIQNVFLSCYFRDNKTVQLYDEMISNKKTDFSRYIYFYADYLENNGKKNKAKKIIEDSLKKYPRNLLLNQKKFDLKNSKKIFFFDCKKEKDVVAELFYIVANALSSQSIFSQSNFYLSLAKYLNNDFKAFDVLQAENFYKTDELIQAKKIYKKLTNYGEPFKWYSDKQISIILNKQGKKEDAISLLKKSYNDLTIKGIYETYDFAQVLKNYDEFEETIKLFSSILERINKSHPLYAKVTDGRGVAYERVGKWDKAEKDLLASLEASPDQAYVINYLAYSWIEKGIKIEKSLKMLEKANELKSNDPYIIDSLGWALFKLQRYEESKRYLQLAVRLLPADPTINDHYGDVLWKNGNEIQARYFWQYVLGLENVALDIEEQVKKKLINGL